MSLAEQRSRLAAPPQGPDGAPASVVEVSPPRNRRRPLIILGSLMVVISALVAAWLVASMRETHDVLVAKHELLPGVEIKASDVEVVEVGGGLVVSSVSANNQRLVVGRYPASVVPAGTLLQSSMFVDADEVVPDGQVVVAAVLDPGQIPPGLSVGGSVQLIATVDAEQDRTAIAVGVGELFSLDEDDDGYRVSLLIDDDLQLVVAAAAAGGDLSLGMVR